MGLLLFFLQQIIKNIKRREKMTKSIERKYLTIKDIQSEYLPIRVAFLFCLWSFSVLKFRKFAEFARFAKDSYANQMIFTNEKLRD